MTLELAAAWLALGAGLRLLRGKDWLCLLLALLPVASFAHWTGSIYVEEFDLIALGCLVAHGLCGPHRVITLSRPAVAVLAVLGVAWVTACVRGFFGADWHASPLDANALAHYDSGWNALRVGRSLVLGFLIAMAALSQWRGRALWQMVLRGNAFGLGLASLVCVWERAAFPGLGNFASDYRITGPFWEMHTGGAALDAYLAMSLPAMIWLGARAGSARVRALSLAGFAMASYVVFATFSRMLYVAYGASLLVLAFFGWRATAGVATTRAPGRALFFPIVSLAASALVMPVFSSGGYRGMAAVLAVMFIAGWLGGVRFAAAHEKEGAAWRRFALAAVSTAALAAVFGKGAYLAFAAAAAAFVAAALRSGPAPVVWAMAGWLSVCAVAVAGHWGGVAALPPAALAVAAALAMAALGAAKRWWVWSARVAVLWSGVLMLGGLTAALAQSDFLDARLAHLGRDAEHRLAHWRAAYSMWSDAPPAAQIFGLGLGRWPYLTRAHEAAGGAGLTHEFLRAEDGPLLRLRAQPPGAADVLRVVQSLPRLDAQAAVLTFEARSEPGARVSVALCYKHLLYAESCSQMPLRLRGNEGGWQPYTLAFDLSHTWPGPWYAPRTAMLSLAAESGTLDLRSLSLVDSRGEEQLSNGDFSRGAARWFFTSDHHHLPWHVKQLGLSALVETGALGAVALAASLALAAWQLARSARRGAGETGFVLAGLVGALAVGLTDTLLDVPRIACLIFLILVLAVCDREGHSGAA